MNPKYNGKCMLPQGMAEARNRNIVVNLPGTGGLVYCGDEIWKQVSFAEAHRNYRELEPEMQNGWWEPVIDFSSPIHRAACRMAGIADSQKAAVKTLHLLIEYGRKVLAKRAAEGKIHS